MCFVLVLVEVKIREVIFMNQVLLNAFPKLNQTQPIREENVKLAEFPD